MVHIILVRHGETDWNTQQVFRGRVDVALNKVGLAQAEVSWVFFKRSSYRCNFFKPSQQGF